MYIHVSTIDTRYVQDPIFQRPVCSCIEHLKATIICTCNYTYMYKAIRFDYVHVHCIYHVIVCTCTYLFRTVSREETSIPVSANDSMYRQRLSGEQ